MGYALCRMALCLLHDFESIQHSVFPSEHREVNIALWMSLKVCDKTVGALYGVIEIVVDGGVGDKFAERAVRILHLRHHCMHTADGTVDAVHGSLHVNLIELGGKERETVAGLCNGCRELRYVMFQETFQLLAAAIKIVGDLLRMLHDEGQIGIAEQDIHSGDEGIYFLNKTLYIGNDVAGTFEYVLLFNTPDGVAGLVACVTILGKIQMERAAAKHSGFKPRLCAFTHTQVAVGSYLHNDLARVIEVISDVADAAYLETIGINATTLGQPLCIAKRDVIDLTGSKQANALQKLYAKKENGKSGDAYQSNYYFLLHDR